MHTFLVYYTTHIRADLGQKGSATVNYNEVKPIPAIVFGCFLILLKREQRVILSAFSALAHHHHQPRHVQQPYFRNGFSGSGKINFAAFLAPLRLHRDDDRSHEIENESMSPSSTSVEKQLYLKAL